MKKIIVLLFFCSIARAGTPDALSFLPAQTDAQKSFKSDLASGNYSRALSDWQGAFDGSAFASTEDGRAIRLYVLAQNGLPLSAMRQLVLETQPHDLHNAVLNLWKPLLNSYVSELSVRSAAWEKIFPSKPMELWKIATTAPQSGNTSAALKALNELRQMKQFEIGEDQITLATARVLYQRGDVDAALARYNSISKSSDLWIQSLEERAWAHLRKNQHDEAVNDITTLLSSPLAPLSGPEPYFLSELTSLQVCDYPKILRTSKQFKERHHERLIQLEQLAKTGINKVITDVMTSFDENGFNLRSVGSNVEFLPHDFMRDRVLSSAVRSRLELLTENKNASDLSDKAPEVKSWILQNSKEADRARSLVLSRLKALASEELVEYRQTINKLQIVEAEVIQRLYVDERLKGQRPPVLQAKDDENTLHFPYSENEVWLDELDHYKSNVKECPTLPSLKGASL